MRITEETARVVRACELSNLDPVTIVLRDFGGAGQVMVQCFGKAWSAHFGSIGGGQSLVEFLGTDHHYLASKLARGDENKAERAYLLRVSEAVVAACAQLVAAPEAVAHG